MKIVSINPGKRFTNYFYTLTIYNSVYRPRIFDDLDNIRYLCLGTNLFNRWVKNEPNRAETTRSIST